MTRNRNTRWRPAVSLCLSQPEAVQPDLGHGIPTRVLDCGNPELMARLKLNRADLRDLESVRCDRFRGNALFDARQRALAVDTAGKGFGAGGRLRAFDAHEQGLAFPRLVVVTGHKLVGQPVAPEHDTSVG